jgi:hypothetical protein
LRGDDLAGTPLEDVGVKPDQRYWMKERDVLVDNQGLLDAAAALK